MTDNIIDCGDDADCEECPKAALIKLLKQISSVDKTPEYVYDPNNKSKHANADGELPEPGCRWNTPREICAVYLRDIETGRLKEAIKELMGVPK